MEYRSITQLRNDVERKERELHHVKQLIGGYEQQEQLLQRRKLVLLLDLDHTLLHSSTATAVAPDGVFRFQLEGDGPLTQRQTRLRPHVDNFLKNMNELFQLQICTQGIREYANKMAIFLDMDGHYFGDRIISREDIGSLRSKTGVLDTLFPVGDHLVVIIDDQTKVWGSAPNVIGVKPYSFFGQADVNHLNDGDDYLLHLETMLRGIHGDFFRAHDASVCKEDVSLTHVKDFMAINVQCPVSLPPLTNRATKRFGNCCQEEQPLSKRRRTAINFTTVN